MTTYKRENGKIYLNGTKTFITSSKGVKYLIIMCRDADNPDVISEFFVDMSKPGISLSPLTKLGLRMDSCCEVYLTTSRWKRRTSSAKRATASTAASLTSTSSAGSLLLATTARLSLLSKTLPSMLGLAFLRQAVARFQLNSLKFCHMAIKLDSMRNMLTKLLGTPTPTSAATSTAGQAAMCKYFLRQRFLRGR